MVKKLAKWLKDNKQSQSGLARSIGYNPTSVCEVLSGRREASFKFATMVERITGLPASGWATKKKARA